jgi:hypothetical protein
LATTEVTLEGVTASEFTAGVEQAVEEAVAAQYEVHVSQVTVTVVTTTRRRLTAGLNLRVTIEASQAKVVTVQTEMQQIADVPALKESFAEVINEFLVAEAQAEVATASTTAAEAEAAATTAAEAATTAAAAAATAAAAAAADANDAAAAAAATAAAEASAAADVTAAAEAATAATAAAALAAVPEPIRITIEACTPPVVTVKPEVENGSHNTQSFSGTHCETQTFRTPFTTAPKIMVSVSHMETDDDHNHDSIGAWTEWATATEFRYCVKEYNHDNNHDAHSLVQYVAWTGNMLGDAVADQFRTQSKSSGSQCDTITFPTPFDSVPTVVSSIDHTNSDNSPTQKHNPIFHWIEGITANEFKMCTRESRDADGPHAAININYIASPTGANSFYAASGRGDFIGGTGLTFSGRACQRIPFAQPFTRTPNVLVTLNHLDKSATSSNAAKNSIITWAEDITLTDFEVCTRENVHDDTHGGESQVDWIAFDDVTLPQYDGGFLLISEYIEGSSYTKGLELFNPTDETISLDETSIQFHHNGAVNDASDNFDLPTSEFSGSSIPPGGTFVICKDVRTVNSRDNHIEPTGECDMHVPSSGDFTNVLVHNGDDAIELKYEGTTIDVIGVVGEDPGSCWKAASGGCMTKEKTIRRKSSITSGSTTWDNTQWDIFDQNTVDGAGAHSGAMLSI